MDEGHYRKIVNSSVYEVFTIFEIDEWGNTMNDAIAMMFSILIVMFGYLVFKIRTDQSQSTTASTRKRSKKRGTGKPVIKNNWNMRPLDTKDPADKDLRYEDFVESSWKEIEK